MTGIRITLRIGGLVFLLSALLLILVPGVFLDLLALDGASAPLQWSMRMIGVTLIALAANMWAVSMGASDRAIFGVGLVMAIVATALGILTLATPAPRGWFAILYAGVGFGFGLAYLASLLWWRSSGLKARRART